MGLALPLPRHIRRRPLAWAGGHLLRWITAAALSCIVTVAASSAVFVTTAPEFISLLIEPISLLLTPGLVVAMIVANVAKPFRHGAKAPTHDFTPQAVVIGTFLFYFVFFVLVLAWRARRARRQTTLATSR